MGGKKGGETTVVNQTTTPTATAEETELNKLQLEQQRAIQPEVIDIQKKAYDLGQLLLQGQGLPGFLNPLPQGATAQTLPNQPDIPVYMSQLGENYTQDLVQKSLRDIYPQFQQMGLPVESGVAQSIAGRTAGDIRRNVAESNIDRQLAVEEYNRAQRQATGEFNVNTKMATQYQNLNNLLNLLNLAVGGQAQIQSPVLSTGASLGQRLAGLRSTNTQGTSRTNNPFLSNLMSSAGSGLGSGITSWISRPGGSQQTMMPFTS